MLERLATSKEVQVPNNHMADKEGSDMQNQFIAKILEAANEEPTPRLLAFDPTPAGLVDDRSLRRAFKNEWARIRARHFKEDGTACALCEVVEPEENLIEGHEVYSFPSPKVVRLERYFIRLQKMPLCDSPRANAKPDKPLQSRVHPRDRRTLLQDQRHFGKRTGC